MLQDSQKQRKPEVCWRQVRHGNVPFPAAKQPILTGNSQTVMVNRCARTDLRGTCSAWRLPHSSRRLIKRRDWDLHTPLRDDGYPRQTAPDGRFRETVNWESIRL